MMTGNCAVPTKLLIFKIVKIRWHQVYRGVSEIGIFRMLFLLAGLMPLLMLFLWQKISERPYNLVIPLALGVVVYLVHKTRKDQNLLRMVTETPRLVYMAEYGLIFCPVAVIALFQQAWLAFALSLLMAALPALAPAGMVHSVSTPAKLRWIPAGMYEWQSGIRGEYIFLAFAYLLGLAGFLHPGLYYASLFLLTLPVASFYSHYESRAMIIAFAPTAKKFLKLKIIRHAGWFGIALLPLLLLASVDLQQALINLLCLLAAINVLIFSILLKYYNYRPDSTSAAHGLMIIFACIISAILPAALLILLANLLLLPGTVKNLRSFIHAEN